MYVPSKFAETRLPVLQAFIVRTRSRRSSSKTADGLDAQHAPLLLDATRGAHGVLQGHIARANPLWRRVDDAAVDLMRETAKRD